MLETTHDMTPEVFRVVDSWGEVPSIRTLVLEPMGEFRQPRPGQFAMLFVPGFGECAISYSRIGESTITHTVKAVGGVSQALTRLKAGDQLGSRGPFGTAWPVSAAEGRDLVIVAGGLGLAPLRPVVDIVTQYRHRFGEVHLVAGARNPELFLYLDEVLGLNSIHTHLTVDVGDAGWRHDVGVVTQRLPDVNVDVNNAVAMVCGPEIMMKYSAFALRDMGLETQNIYVSMERNMQCGIGICGHCQLGPYFICKDGPVMAFDTVSRYFDIREI